MNNANALSLNTKLLKFSYFFGFLYGFFLYFQGLYIYLIPDLHHNGIMRDPNLPLWLKLSDEFLFFLIALIMFVFRKKHELFKINKRFFFLVLSSLYFILNIELYKMVQTDNVGLSVAKTLISFFTLGYIFSFNQYHKFYFSFLKSVVLMILFSQIVGIIFYYLINYTVYGNRLIGLSLNPNFNAIHAAFILLLGLSTFFQGKTKHVAILVGSLSLFLSCSLTAFAVIFFVITIVWINYFFKNETFTKKLFFNSLIFVFYFLTILATSYFGRANILFNDYTVKFFSLKGDSVVVDSEFLVSKRNYILELSKDFTPHSVVSRPANAVHTSTISNGRVFGAKKVINEIINFNQLSKLLFGITSDYGQTDSSWLNILYNFGLLGILILFLNVLFFIKTFLIESNFIFSFSFSLKPFVSIVFNNPMKTFSIGFLILGSVLQQFLENWNVSFILLMAFLLSTKLSMNKIKELKNGEI